MLTYQVRPRTFRLKPGIELSFPSPVRVDFHFVPPQPFGAAARGGRTAVKGVAATVSFQATTGQHYIESKQPLAPLDLTIETPVQRLQLKGSLFSIETSCASLQELGSIIESVYFALPFLFNIEFADPPLVERVEGLIGTVPFRWELSTWEIDFETTTQEVQEQRAARSINRFGLVAESARRRLLAAAHYFHVACRLDRVAQAPGEFMAEALLNLSKVLEVLFPPQGESKTRDAARAGLRALGYSDTEIERDFLPVMALRSEIDVAHVGLALFTRSQLQVIHSYAERAEQAIRRMLRHLLEKVEVGEFEVAAWLDSKPRAETLEVIKRLESSLATVPNGGDAA